MGTTTISGAAAAPAITIAGAASIAAGIHPAPSVTGGTSTAGLAHIGASVAGGVHRPDPLHTAPHTPTPPHTGWLNVPLLTSVGAHVVTAVIPAYQVPANAIRWGSRTFFRNAAGQYLEGLMAVPVRTLP